MLCSYVLYIIFLVLLLGRAMRLGGYLSNVKSVGKGSSGQISLKITCEFNFILKYCTISSYRHTSQENKRGQLLTTAQHQGSICSKIPPPPQGEKHDFENAGENMI